MATLTLTDAYLAKLSEQNVETVADLQFGSFKIGEGGWEEIASVKVPRAPDSSLTDLDCIENPSRYPASSRYHFEKTITSGYITQVSATVVRVECVVDMDEANDDGYGNDPEFYEIAVFDADGDMMGYATFTRQLKDNNRTLIHRCTLAYAQAA